MELDVRQLGELGLGEGVDGTALGVEGEAIHEGEFLHLGEGVAFVEVAGDEELGRVDFGVVEILAAGGFGQELEDIIERRILEDVALIGFLHFLFCGWRGCIRGGGRCPIGRGGGRDRGNRDGTG